MHACRSTLEDPTRNSLYVAVAIGRILHGYQTAEVLDLLSTLAQDPERVPEDSYLRHVKGALVREVKERFGPVLRTEIGPRGEEFFVASPPTPSQRLLVNRALELLTPWDTSCPVPESFDAMRHTLRALRFAGKNPDDEHAIEVNRMHSLIHPECFDRLTTGLRLESPADRLRLPKPFRSSSRDDDDDDRGDGVGSTSDRTRPPTLSRAEVERYSTERSRLDHERRTFSPSRIELRVDNVERLSLDPRADAQSNCTLDAGAEVVEVWGKGRTAGEVLLGVHVVRLTRLLAARSPAGEEQGAWEEAVVALPGGRELVMTFNARTGAEADPRSIELVAECRASSLAARWRSRPSGDGVSWWRGLVIPAGAVTVLLATGVALFVARSREPVDRQLGDPSPIPADAGERTRGSLRPKAAATLATTRLLYLDLDEGPDAERLNELLRNELAASGRFEITTDVDIAQAALKGALATEPSRSGEPARVRLALSLVDEEGRILWSADETGDSVEAVARRVAAELVARAR